MQLFALQTSRPFGERVSQVLGVPLSEHKEREFEDGEHKVRPLESVRARDVYVLHALYGDAEQTVNDKLCRLLFFIGALKDAGAARVTAVVPYLCYARKDRKTKPRDPVTTRYVATLFEAVGTDRVVAIDVHNLAAYQNAFRCRTVHLEAHPLFVDHLTEQEDVRNVVVVAPDAGGLKRAEPFRQALAQHANGDVPRAFVEKYRSGDVVGGEAFVGEVKGKTAVILDDLISTGTTLVRAARACRARGAERVLAFATHGVFAGDANEKLSDDALDHLVTTNTISPFRLDEPVRRKLTVLDAAPLFAEAIQRLHDGGDIVALRTV